jgi:hypothetical protein
MSNAFCFALWEWYGTSCSCCQVSKICVVFGYGFQHIPLKWMHHMYPDIVWHLNIDSAHIHAPCSCISIFFSQMSLISIRMPSLPTHHWLCVITSWTSLQHVSTAPTNTWYHYLLVLLLSKSCCHHGKREVRLLHCVDDHGHDIYVITVSSSTGFFVLGLVYPWDCCSIVNALHALALGLDLVELHEVK